MGLYLIVCSKLNDMECMDFLPLTDLPTIRGQGRSSYYAQKWQQICSAIEVFAAYQALYSKRISDSFLAVGELATLIILQCSAMKPPNIIMS